MPSIQFNYVGEFENGSTFQVRADQRDVARWEQQEFGCDFTQAMQSKQFTFVRFTAWSALDRRGETELSWPEFDAQCVEVAAPAGLVVGVDPTVPDQPGDTSSNSRSSSPKRGRRSPSGT